MRIFTHILLIIVILLGITFAVLNHNEVMVHYYLGQISMPLSILLVLSFAIGCLIGLFVSLGLSLRLKIKNYRLHHLLKMAEKEIENLRAIPIQDRH